MRKTEALLKGMMLASSLVAISACTFRPSISISSSSSSSSSSFSSESTYVPEGYYKADDVGPINYTDIQKSLGIDAIPSTGDIELLVVPVQFDGYEFTNTKLREIEKAVNGDGDKDTGYWESLSSFYNKSSYGKLNMHCTVSEVYECGYTPASFVSAYGAAGNGTNVVLEKAVEQYKSIHGESSTQKFDYDGNGAIDGVIMVYSCPTYANDWDIWNIDKDTSIFWGYTYWDYLNFEADVSSPNPLTYFWMSIDFFHFMIGGNGLDTHCLIHETGHMLGLDDYYAPGQGEYAGYSAAGAVLMMGDNVNDHDMFSKMALNWAAPYVVYDDCEITIGPSSSTGDCIVVNDCWNGSAFDEYLLIEFFTPEGLNYLDSKESYGGSYPRFTKSGVKIYHIDARLMKSKRNSDNWKYSYDLELENGYQYRTGATNNAKGYYPGDPKYDLIGLISADNTNTFHNTVANDDSLFKVGDTFNMAKYSKYFPNETTLNSGEPIEYDILIEEMTASSATIKFTRNALSS